MQIKLTTAEYLDPDFCWYEFFSSTTNLALGSVVASAEFKAISLSTLFVRGGLVSGSVWYSWVRAVYSNGTVFSSLTALGAITAIYVETADIDDDAVTYAKLQNVSASSRFLGRITSGAGNAEELTGTQATTLLNAFSSTLKGLVPASGGGTTNFLRADGSFAAPPGTATVTSVDLSVPSILSVSGGPITTSGTLAVTLATQTANRVFAGPTTGSAAIPTFRALVGADLPLPAAATLGGVFSKAAVSHQFLTSISNVDGSVGQAQPAFSDLSGTASAAQLPLPGAATLGGVFSKAAVTHNFLTSISSVDGSVGQAQPAFSDLSGSATLAQFPTMANNTVLGNVVGSTAVPVALTATQLTTLVNAFTSALKGAVPASGGGTTNFLRADGTWAAPSGGGSSTGTPYLAVTMNNSQNISQAVTTRVNFDTVATDTGSYWDATNKRYTPLVAGRYLVLASVGVGAPGTNAAGSYLLEAEIRKNGTFVRRSTHITAAAVITGANHQAFLAAEVQLNGSTDYIDLSVYSDNGSPAITGNSLPSSYLEIHYICA